jgi:hypothetical protein
LHRRLDGGGGLRLVRDVAHDGERLVAGLLELVLRRRQRPGVDVREDDGSAGVRELLHGRQTDTRAGSGDECDLPSEVVSGVQRRVLLSLASPRRPLSHMIYYT